MNAPWVTEAVRGIARQYASQGPPYEDKTLLPILADALEDAGYQDSGFGNYQINLYLGALRDGLWGWWALMLAE